MTMSGLMFHPSSNVTGAGLSFASPSAAPLSAQSPVILEVAVSRIGKPWRHFPVDDGRLHCLCPRPPVRIGHKGHRSDLARAMTHLAVLLQDRKNIFIKGHRGGLR